MNFTPADAVYSLLIGDPLLPTQSAKLLSSKVVHVSIDPNIPITKPNSTAEDEEGNGGGVGSSGGGGDTGNGESDPDRIITNARAAINDDGLLTDNELLSLFKQWTDDKRPISAYDQGLRQNADTNASIHPVTFASVNDVPANRLGGFEPIYTSYTHVSTLHQPDGVFFSAWICVLNKKKLLRVFGDYIVLEEYAGWVFTSPSKRSVSVLLQQQQEKPQKIPLTISPPFLSFLPFLSLCLAKKKNLLSHAKHTQITSSSWILEIAKSPSKALPNRTLPRVLSLVCRKAKDAEATTSPYALHCLGRDCKIVVAAAIAVAAAVVVVVVVVVALAPFLPLSSCEINFQRLLRSSSRVDKVERGGKEKKHNEIMGISNKESDHYWWGWSPMLKERSEVYPLACESRLVQKQTKRNQNQNKIGMSS